MKAIEREGLFLFSKRAKQQQNLETLSIQKDRERKEFFFKGELKHLS